MTEISPLRRRMTEDMTVRNLSPATQQSSETVWLRHVPDARRGLPRNFQDKAITQAIINLGKSLGLTLVAEGVETTEQDKFLRDHGCDEIQGYLICKPVTAAEIGTFLRMPDGKSLPCSEKTLAC
jgi:hypothetical protein